MQKWVRLIWLMWIVMVFVTVGAFGQFVICRKCGYENEERARVCTHCQAPLPVRDSVSANLVEEVEEPRDGYISLQLVRDEMAEGHKFLQAQDYELARLFFLNALALEGVTEPTDHKSRSEQLLQLIQVADASSLQVRKACPRCGGSGQQPVHFEGLRPVNRDFASDSGQALSAPGRSGVRCRKCDGSGSVLAVGTIDDMKYLRGTAAAAFRQYQQARRYEPLGGAWIPAQLVDTLTVRQKAAIMRSIVLPCKSCAGHGRFDCKRCGGVGRIDCNKCENGRVPYEHADGGMQRLGADRTKECEECHGSGTVPCETCDEEGSLVCKSCNGTGEADICRTCSARGYVTCKRCSGTKLYRGETCPACKGEGDTLCRSCNGRGRRD